MTIPKKPAKKPAKAPTKTEIAAVLAQKINTHLQRVSEWKDIGRG